MREKTPFPEFRKIDTLSCGARAEGVAWKHRGSLLHLPAVFLSHQCPLLPAGCDKGQVQATRLVQSPGPLSALVAFCVLSFSALLLLTVSTCCSFPKAYPWAAGAWAACLSGELARCLWDFLLSCNSNRRSGSITAPALLPSSGQL